MKILLAEDDPISRTLALRALESWGHEVVVTQDGPSALKAFKENPDVRLAVLDWMMPEMSGIDVCRAIREDTGRSHTYVIMLTAMTDSNDAVRALDAGADDYVRKPFNVPELRSRIGAGERVVNLEDALRTKIDELESVLAHVKELQGIIPICAWCKRIRNDTGYWNSVEEYIQGHSQVEFSHSMCPDCMRERYGDDAVADEDAAHDHDHRIACPLSPPQK